ncbi:uncharacterized protein LOC143914939 [Arctopsyche grandis]|uniref:uncharacterized protein LOC143914939 n=1 Tax=Arctopsyche grandis TaxID=121162 RepID=UPI00406D8A1D
MDESNDTPIVLRDDIIGTINRISKNEKIENATLHISEATAKGDNYVGKLYRVKAIDKHGKSISLIVKCAPDDTYFRDNFPIRVIFEREILTYSEILPAMDALQDEFKIPKKDRFCHAEYYESINEVEKECLFFGDLAVEGYKMYDRQKSFDNQHLEHVVKTLARLHATSFVMKKTKPELYEKLSQKVSEPLDFGEGETIVELSRKKGSTVIENAEIRKKVEDALENPLEKYKSFIDYKRTAPYNVICHGDCWINNFLFKYENQFFKMSTAESNDTPIVLRDDIIETINRISKYEKIEDATLDISEATNKGDNYLGKLYRVKASDKHGKSISVIVKCAPDFIALREVFPVASIYEKEIFTYSEILPALDALQDEFNIPEKDRFHHAKHYESVSEVEKECLFIGDLAVDGYKMYNRQKPFDKQHLELVMKTLAQLHVTSFAMKKIKPELYEKLTQKISEPFDFGTSIDMMEMGKGKSISIIESAEIKIKLEEALDNIVEKFYGFLDHKKTAPFNVICHGDCWINNFLFKYKDDQVLELKFVDWQLTRLASPITDIAYMMFSSTDEQVRSDCYTRSLDLYYETLDKNITMMGCKISECYPREVFEDQIKSTMPFGLITSMMLLTIILADKENVPDGEMKPEDFTEDKLDNLISKTYRERYNGVAKDFAAYGLI